MISSHSESMRDEISPGVDPFSDHRVTSPDLVSTLSIPPFHSYFGFVPRREHLEMASNLLSTILIQQNVIDSLSRQLSESEGMRIRLEESISRSRYEQQ